MTGSFKFIEFNTETYTSKIKKSTTLNMTRTTITDSVGNALSHNLIVSFDKSTNDILLHGLSYTNTESSEISTITTNTFLANKIYLAVTDAKSDYGYDVHYLYWLPNINLIKTWFNYDKASANIRSELNTLADRGDGMCCYDFGCRTVSDIVKININGITNAWINSGNYSPTRGGDGHTGFRVRAGGLFINSGGSSLGFAPVADTARDV